MTLFSPDGSAIAKLLDAYRLQLDQLPDDELMAQCHRAWSAEVHETQLLGFYRRPPRDILIKGLLDKRECELSDKSPLEIDELLDELSN